MSAEYNYLITLSRQYIR